MKTTSKPTTLRLDIELTYDADIMQSGNEDPDAREWFLKTVLNGDDLLLHSNDIGDTVGNVKVLAIR